MYNTRWFLFVSSKVLLIQLCMILVEDAPGQASASKGGKSESKGHVGSGYWELQSSLESSWSLTFGATTGGWHQSLSVGKIWFALVLPTPLQLEIFAWLLFQELIFVCPSHNFRVHLSLTYIGSSRLELPWSSIWPIMKSRSRSSWLISVVFYWTKIRKRN